MNRFVKMLLLAGVVLSLRWPVHASGAAEGIELRHAATGNTLICPPAEARYLLLPVEEEVPDARVEVLVNGDLVRTFYVRLARRQVDYTVPFDLRPYASRGRVVLNVVAARTPELKEEAQHPGGTPVDEGWICWEQLRLADSFDTANTEKYRPAYHHTPAYGWMNDPNGMFWKDGCWHLYFQYNPYGSKWQNMTWGHSVSRDLVHWEQLPNAIEPNGLGTVFSGSAVVDKANTAGFGEDAVVALYTSAGESQVQSLASSTDDGRTFAIYAGNPVIATRREARDPNMFWHEPTGRWILVLAHALDREMLIYSSPDLKNWSFESAFGQGYGCQKGVWECPDLVELPVRGTDEKRWVLICNINPGGPAGGSATQYFVGDFDGHRFTCDDFADETRWMDYGKDFYAAVTWSNAPAGRHTAIAWMSNWEYADRVPTLQFRSANTLPRELELFRGSDGKLYLASSPSPEVEALRGGERHYGAATLSQQPRAYALPEENDGICEIALDLDFRRARTVKIRLSNEAGEHLSMVYDLYKHTFSMHRQQSGLTSFSDHFPASTKAPLLVNGRTARLRLFVDRCSVEAFDGEGHFAMTNLLFPTSPYTTLTVSAAGGDARLKGLSVWSLGTQE